MASFSYRLRFRRDHRWAPRHMSDYLDGDLAAGGQIRLERHVHDCEECRRLLAGLHRMLEALHGLPAPAGSGDAAVLATAVLGRVREPPAG